MTALHTLSRGERRTAAAQLVGQRVTVDIEHARDGARAKWSGQLVAVAEPLSQGMTDTLILTVDDGRTVAVSLTTVARLRAAARPRVARAAA